MAREHPQLTPDDPRQVPGKKPRRWPLAELEVGDWCMAANPSEAASIRSCISAGARKFPDRRFTVKKSESEPGRFIVTRLA